MTIAAHQKPVSSVAISQNGEVIATGGSDNDVKLWDLKTGKEINRFSQHLGNVWAVAISPDSQTVASGSADTKIMLWDVKTGKLKQTLFGHTDQVHAIAWSPDGQTLASGSGGVGKDFSVRLWDVASGKETAVLKGHNDRVYAIAFSADGDKLATGSLDKTINIWDSKSGEILQTLDGSKFSVDSLLFTPNGQSLISSDYLDIKVWNLNTGEANTLKGHRDVINAIALSNDGQYLATASKDKTVKLWDLARGQEIATLTGHNQEVRSVAFSDGYLVSGDTDGKMKIWTKQ